MFCFFFIHRLSIYNLQPLFLGRCQAFRKGLTIRVRQEKSAASIQYSRVEPRGIVYEYKMPSLQSYFSRILLNMMNYMFFYLFFSRERERETWGTLIISHGTFICLRASWAPWQFIQSSKPYIKVVGTFHSDALYRKEMSGCKCIISPATGRILLCCWMFGFTAQNAQLQFQTVVHFLTKSYA